VKISKLVHSILWRRAEPFPTFRVHPDRVHGSRTSDAPRFIPNQTYFEIRMSQMHLRDRRDLWVRYIPSATFIVEFQFDGKRLAVPVVVGSGLLRDMLPEAAKEPIEHLNERVAGPYPYEGDDVRLFAGLFKVQTKDYAAPALQFLETVAKAFDVTRLSTYISIAKPLLSGVESLLGMHDSMVTGMRQSYEPPSSEEGDASAEAFQPAFHLMLTSNGGRFDLTQQRRFWVVDGRLHIGETLETAREERFTDADFMLFRINALSARHDYALLDFHSRYWRRVVDHIWSGNTKAAKVAYEEFRSSLARCSDLVYPQRNALLDEYARQFRDETLLKQGGGTGQAFEGGQPKLRLSERDLRLAALGGMTQGALGPRDPLEALAATAGAR
jgi:hypothetical protein